MKYLSLAAAASIALAAVPAVHAQNYNQVNLVANAASTSTIKGDTVVVDPNLVDPWGLSRSATSPWWIADTFSGKSTLYDGAGAITPLVVTVPKGAKSSFAAGTPTGVIVNPTTTEFLLKTGDPASFIFDSLDGTISGWNPNVGLATGAKAPSTNAVTVFTSTAKGAQYTGLTSALVGTKTYLYAANYGAGTVDVLNGSFQPVTLPAVPDGDAFNPGTTAPFTDEFLPAGYSPFNVQAIGNNVVVAYAAAGFAGGPGSGYVDIYSSTGVLLQRLEHTDWLNLPWGIALAPNDFGTYSHDLLIGEFGSGNITVFNPTTGEFIAQLKNANNQTIAIDGLWSITFGNPAPKNATTASANYDATGAPAAELYFTAGPNGGKDGLFGYLVPFAAQNTAGNNQ